MTSTEPGPCAHKWTTPQTLLVNGKGDIGSSDGEGGEARHQTCLDCGAGKGVYHPSFWLPAINYELEPGETLYSKGLVRISLRTVEALPGRTLRITFSDGTSGEADLGSLIRLDGPDFAHFARVFSGVWWPGANASVTTPALYRLVHGKDLPSPLRLPPTESFPWPPHVLAYSLTPRPVPGSSTHCLTRRQGISGKQRWIRHYREADARLVNATDGGEGTLGYVPPEEAREKMRVRMRNRPAQPPPTPETRAKMAKSQRQRFEWEQANGISRKGKKRSPETSVNISRALTGRKLTPEHRRKLSEAHQNPSEELREKWRQAVLNRPAEVRQAFASNQKGKSKSDETRKKMSEAAMGRPRTEETKQKLREANMGKVQSDETKRKKAEAVKAFWANLTPEERAAKARGKKAV